MWALCHEDGEPTALIFYWRAFARDAQRLPEHSHLKIRKILVRHFPAAKEVEHGK
jgi:hypothetical protein